MRCLFENFVFLMNNSLLKSYKNYTQNFSKIFIKIKRPHQYYISIQISGKTPSQFKILRNHIQFSKKSNQKFYQPLKLKSFFKMFLIIRDESEGIYAFHPLFRLLTLYTRNNKVSKYLNNKVSIAVEIREVLLNPSLFLDPCP